MFAGGVAYAGPYFGRGVGLIHMDGVRCSGMEPILHECVRDKTITFCDHSKDAGVRCSSEKAANCSNGDVRLVGGHDNHEGRVEVCYNRKWGMVCQKNWDYRDASVVCYQLGYSGKIVLSTYTYLSTYVCLSINIMLRKHASFTCLSRFRIEASINCMLYYILNLTQLQTWP